MAEGAWRKLSIGTAVGLIASSLWPGSGPAAPPVLERATPTPVTAVTFEALGKVPASRDLKTILDYHNQLRAEAGARPLRWNPELAAGAAAYAAQLSQTGEVRHASREGRKTVRENLRRGPRGIYSPLQMVQSWGNEKRNFRPGTFPNVAADGNVDSILHYTQMIWPTTTDVGCALHSDRAYDWLICRYSPPGNRDGVAIGPGALIPAQQLAAGLCTRRPGGPLMCPGPNEAGPNQDGAGNANEGGGQDQGAGDTRERPRAAPQEGLSTVTGDCGASVLASVKIIEKKDPQQPNKPRRMKESNNLAKGFSEIVIPYGWDADVDWAPDPNPLATFPAPGTMTATWEIVGQPNSRKASVTGGYPELQAGWSHEEGLISIEPTELPTVQRHEIEAWWDPVPPTNPDKCRTGHEFGVTFAAVVPTPDALNLHTFVGQAGGAGFPGTRARERGTTTGTRSFHEGEPKPYGRTSRRTGADGKSQVVTNVIVPIGTYWDLEKDCCGIKRAERKIVQFARAAIEGPNGRLGKGWALDILPSELSRAGGDQPTHNPTYTGHPRSDGNETPEPGGAGGTRSIGGEDMLQWDAPGMPKDLFDRLHAAQGRSVYRQQFLSLVVCRPPGPNLVSTYLGGPRSGGAKVCRVGVTTVRWDFPGQAGVQPRPPRRRGDSPEMPYKQPTITVSFDSRDGNCVDLGAFLRANNLLNAFERPTTEGRNLELLSEQDYQQLGNDVRTWEANPLAQLR